VIQVNPYIFTNGRSTDPRTVSPNNKTISEKRQERVQVTTTMGGYVDKKMCEEVMRLHFYNFSLKDDKDGLLLVARDCSGGVAQVVIMRMHQPSVCVHVMSTNVSVQKTCVVINNVHPKTNLKVFTHLKGMGHIIDAVHSNAVVEEVGLHVSKRSQSESLRSRLCEGLSH